MTFKKILSVALVFCITAILAIALCGCDDLGEYEDEEEYYGSFGDVVLISATSRESKEYSVEEYFYNKDSREDFLSGEDGVYNGVPYSDYVYMAIPFDSDIDMDTLALYIRSQSDVTVYISVFITDDIPQSWRPVTDIIAPAQESGDSTDDNSDDTSEEDENEYDDPDPAGRIGDVAVHLKKEKWGSFVLDTFTVNGLVQKSIQIEDGQYILLQIRNNSGIRIFDEENNVYIDPQTNLELQRAQITMTNMLVRALDVKNDEAQGGE